MRLVPVIINHAVRAIKLAVFASNAFLGIMHGDPVVKLMHRFRGATSDTGGVLAVVAKCRNIVIPDIRESAYGLGNFVGPIDTFRNVVFVSAGYTAGAAAHTALKIYDHGISWHLFTS
jgi:hypothetical protein